MMIRAFTKASEWRSPSPNPNQPDLVLVVGDEFEIGLCDQFHILIIQVDMSFDVAVCSLLASIDASIMWQHEKGDRGFTTQFVILFSKQEHLQTFLDKLPEVQEI